MRSEVVLDDQTVLVSRDRIVGIGPASSTPIPEHAAVVDGDGAYLTPGLVDMHMHTGQDGEVERNPLEDVGALSNLRSVIAAGRWFSRSDLDRWLAIP